MFVQAGGAPGSFACSASIGAAAPGAAGMSRGDTLLSPPAFPHTAGRELLLEQSALDLDQLCTVGTCVVTSTHTISSHASAMYSAGAFWHDRGQGQGVGGDESVAHEGGWGGEEGVQQGS